MKVLAAVVKALRVNVKLNGSSLEAKARKYESIYYRIPVKRLLQHYWTEEELRVEGGDYCTRETFIMLTCWAEYFHMTKEAYQHLLLPQEDNDFGW
jgi:hypothetical protein